MGYPIISREGHGAEWYSNLSVKPSFYFDHDYWFWELGLFAGV